MITFKQLLGRPDGPPIGTFMKIPSVEAVEIIKLAGFDFIVIDGEHAPLSMLAIDHMIVIA